MTRQQITFVFLILAMTTSEVFAQTKPTNKPPPYTANVTASILTPDTVHTEHLGDLNFFDGMPDKETVQKVYDFLDLSRGMEAFLNGIPAASVYAALEGFKAAGLNRGDVGDFEQLMDVRIAISDTKFDDDVLRGGSERQGWSCRRRSPVGRAWSRR